VRSAAPRTHARYERVSGSWRGSLAVAPKTAGGCADRAVNPALVTAGSEVGLDLGRPISAVGEHIIAGVALVKPIQLLAVVHGRIAHGITPDQLVLGVRVHMVLVAEEAAAMLLGPARIAVLLPQGGLRFHPAGVRPACSSASRHECSAASAPARYWHR
jgi:hypothetical protein